DLLSQLPHLTYLDVGEDYNSFGDVFEFVAMSNAITEFLAYTVQYKMTTSDVIRLTKWFRTQPVRRLELAFVDAGAADKDVKKEFYEAMLKCETLETLNISNRGFTDIINISNRGFTDLEFIKWPLALKSLRLNLEGITSDVVKSLASQLEDSGVNHLAIVQYTDKNTEGMEHLLRVLP
ncbi:unnamed protein product, partial [Aphanomyces euteiches]